MKDTGSPKMKTPPREKVAAVTEWRPSERREPGQRRGASAAQLAAPVNPCQPMLVPNPEGVRKTHTASVRGTIYIAILQEGDAISESGQIGALLRREGLYSCNLTT